MVILRLVAIVVVGLGLGLGCAASKTAAPGAAVALPAPDPAKGKAVAWVADSYIYARDGNADHIGAILMEAFVAEQKIVPSKEQIESCAAFLAKNSKPNAFHRQMAEGMVKAWLVDKALYEKYGGVVIFQQMNPMEPVGAYRAFFEDEERKGRLKIFDPALEEKFWKYLRRDHPFKYEGEKKPDYSRPWWEQKK